MGRTERHRDPSPRDECGYAVEPGHVEEAGRDTAEAERIQQHGQRGDAVQRGAEQRDEAVERTYVAVEQQIGYEGRSGGDDQGDHRQRDQERGDLFGDDLR